MIKIFFPRWHESFSLMPYNFLHCYNFFAMQKPLVLRSVLFAPVLFICASLAAQETKPLTTGSIQYNDPLLETLLPKGTKIEVLASGLQNAEGPVWITDSSMLLFSDTKGQAIYRMTLKGERSKFLDHSGFTGRLPYGEEPGSNGLAVYKQTDLLLCEHGDRRVALYPLNGSFGKRTFLDQFQGKRLNSPNDVIVRSDGAVYFTDPPYGLPLKNADPHKETAVNGVYRVDAAGRAALLTGDLVYPNGLAFSPDEKLLYVSVSDLQQPHIMVYAVKEDGTTGEGRVFFDAAGLPRENRKEVTDGLKVDQQGNLWASGPGGLLVLNPAGKLMGIVKPGERVSNCAWSPDGSLYITAGAFVYRIKTNTKGAAHGG